MQNILTDQLTYSKERNTFSAEVSELKVYTHHSRIKVTNPKSGISQIFEKYDVDMDRNEGEVYGWWFKSTEGVKLLIIND